MSGKMQTEEKHSRSKEEERIIAYLLGKLPEKEADQFEQGYLDDAALFGEMEELEDELIDDYASGVLAENDRARFEQHFLCSAERREKVRFAVAMTDRSASWKDKRESEGPLASAFASQSPAIGSTADLGQVLPFRRRFRLVPAWREWGAIAAAILIAIGAGALWLRNRELSRELAAANSEGSRLREMSTSASARADDLQSKLSESERLRTLLAQSQQTQPADTNGIRPEAAKDFSAVLSFDYFNPTTMGTGDVKKRTLQVPVSAGAISLDVVFTQTRFKTFSAKLDRADGTSSWPVNGNFRARSSGEKQTLKLKIPARGLSGDYWLTINGVGPSGYRESIGSYYLIVVRR